MEKKNLLMGVALLVAFSVAVSAGSQGMGSWWSNMKCEKKSVAEGTIVDGKFKPITDRAFAAGEDIWLKGFGYSKEVDVYITVNRQWKCGDDMSQVGYVKKVRATANPQDLGTFGNGYYDIFVDEDGDGIYDCCGKDKCDGKEHAHKGCDSKCDKCGGEIVDGKSFKCFGFEVLPEVATAGLLGVGLVSMVGFVAVRKR